MPSQSHDRSKPPSAKEASSITQNGPPVDAPPSGGESPSSTGSLSIVGAAILLLRHRRLFLLLPLLSALATASFHLFSGPTYRSHSSFTAQTASGNRGGNISAVAAQFGINLASGGGGESAGFYTKLLRSRELLRAAVLTAYPVSTDNISGLAARRNLIAIWGVEGSSEESRIIRAMAHLSEHITTSVDNESGLISLIVRDKDPDLAMHLNRRLLQLLNEFNLQRRQSQARMEREFVEQRLGEARAELTVAEEKMRVFLEQNRSYASSAQLSFEAARLEREVALRQQVFTTLAQAYEQARIEEVRDSPVVTLVERPEGSVRLASPPVLSNVGIGLLFGVIAALLWVAFEAYLGRQRELRPIEYRELLALIRQGGRPPREESLPCEE